MDDIFAPMARLRGGDHSHMGDMADDPLGFNMVSRARRAGSLLDFIPCTPTTTLDVSADTQGGRRGGDTSKTNGKIERKKRDSTTFYSPLSSFIKHQGSGGASVETPTIKEGGSISIADSEDEDPGLEELSMPRTPQPMEETSEGEQQGGATPPMQSTRGSLWDFVKGWTPPRVRFQRSGWSSFGFGLITPQAREDVPMEEVEEEKGEEAEKKGRLKKLEQKKGRFNLPAKKKITPRPNVNKVIQAMRKKSLDPIKASAALEKDYNANSSRAATKSRRSTVARLLSQKYPHRSWLPANEEVIKTLAAILKEAGYKSAKLYLAELKLTHLEAGHEWSGPMARTLTQCQNAATRGRGPKKKAIEVPEDVWADESKEDGSEKVKVVGARRLFALGVQWMMREIEIADFKVKNFNFNPKERTVSIVWDSSKTDPEAASITRVLQCLCGSYGECNIKCPYYNLECIIGIARGMGATEDDYICVDKSGKPASKHQVLNSWRTLFGKGVTGHSTRRSVHSQRLVSEPSRISGPVALKHHPTVCG